MTETVDAPASCPHCPRCDSEYSYQVGELKVCTECAHEWSPGAAPEAPDVTAQPPHAVSMIDDLKSKGSALVGKVKGPTVVRKD